MEAAVLRRGIQGKIDVNKAAVPGGIPSCNNALTVAHVVKAVQIGLEKYFS